MSKGKVSLSHSAISMWNSCGRKYKLHYIDRLRSDVISGALLFGSAMDTALNHLLLTRNLQESLDLFEKSWRFQFINKIGTSLSETTKVVYAKKDWDAELISEEDEKEWLNFQKKNKLITLTNLKTHTENLREEKEKHGFENFTDEMKLGYNYGHWVCLKNKGAILIKAYYQDILPRIKEVLAVQKKFALKNEAGEEIPGVIDIIIRWEDDKIYVADNKTSGSQYEEDAASKSQQLILYNYVAKDWFETAGAIYFVMYKQIGKDRTKICTVCNHDGSEGRHKTCANEINGKRCGGEWNETIVFKGRTDIIVNKISEGAEDLIIDVFDEANSAIKKNVFNPNPSACEAYGKEFRCQFWKKCWLGSDENLIIVK